MTVLRSQWANLRLFPAYFPPSRVLRDALSFGVHYLGDGRAGRHPAIVNLHVTNRCNLSCEWCYNKGNAAGPSDEMSFAEMLSLVRECRVGGTGVFLTGGEPLLRDDLFRVIQEIKSARLPVGLVTNGTLLDPGRIDALMRQGIDSLIVSAQGGPDRATHARLVAVLRTLANRMRSPGPIVNYVVALDSLAGIRPFLADVLPIENVAVRLTHMSFATEEENRDHERVWARRFGEPACTLQTYRFEPPPGGFDEVVGVLRDPGFRRMWSKPTLSSEEAVAWYRPGFQIRRRCMFVWHSAWINADGNVSPCQYYLKSMGNIREQPLEQIWNGDRYRAFRVGLRQGLLPGCQRCCKL